ncbi:uncharacterized protein LOC132165655 [Corylus avellana]|uniref:uncharacterized protein LOC132165655 n=1 Tax=Corylus avellana TaxID=13451 RepID=UPI00286BD8B3|nr:uncharacterized protein LOC132165655 [Corylus avellana]
MSSPYPVLGNRSIDQWKVTELKEELKRRKLTTKGLKDDLIRRLDEALRVEMENAKEDVDNGVDFGSKPVVGEKDAPTVPVAAGTAKELANSGGNKNKNKNTDSGMVQVDINDSAAALDQGKVGEGDILGGTDAARVEEELVVHSTTVETSIEVTETVTSEVVLSEHNLENIETQKENGNSKSLMENDDLKPQLENEDSMPQLENEDPKPQLENEDSKPQLENEDSKPQLENEGLKPPPEGFMLDSSTPENQVSEVSPILGSQVKSDSISTDSVSINEKIELKDNVIADHVKLELDVVNPEMVEPSSSNVVPVGGESHPMDVEVPHENKESDGGKDDNSATDADISKKIDSADLGYSEQLNLDRSSGDDSMEEDVLETRQIDSKYNSEEVENRSEKSEVPVVKEESHIAILGDAISEKKDVHVENENRPAALADKRKLNDLAAVGNNEPLKRQRRWNSEGLKVPEPQSSTTPTTTPKETFQTTPKDTIQPTALKRNFSRSDSTNSENTPKERVVPPSQKPPTNSLRIDRFLRPFTLKAVHELLGKTGSVTSFWMDHIKTHCYVTYSSVEEATETRNAVYNLQWPPNGGRLLVAEFVDPQEVKTRAEEAPQTPTTPASAGPTVPPAPPTSQPQPSPRQHRQQLPPPPPVLPPPPPLSNPPQTRERVHLPPPPPLPEKLDPPIVTLDDLFRKTKATPRIYYLPLSEEQVAAKLAAQGKNTKQ